MSEETSNSGDDSGAKKEVPAPSAKPAGGEKPAPAAAAPKPAPAKPAAKKPPPKKEYPKPVLNRKTGKLLTETRHWPTELWKNPWSLPGYRKAAGIFAAIVVLFFGGGTVVGELSAWGDWIYREGLVRILGPWLPEGASAFGVETAWAVVKVLIVLHIVLLNGIFIIWWERKISAHIQSRLGPMYVGGWHGVLQTVADGIKLMLKENVVPLAADGWVFRLAPIMAVAPAILAFAPVSFGTELAAADLDTGIMYIFAISGVSVIGIVMAGYASGNKFGVLGSLRSGAQLVSYELPRTFSIVPVVLFVGSLSLTAVTDAQAGYWGGVLPRWFVFYPVVGQVSFIIFLIASVAETNRVPFDIPEAESELVAGFHTEYAGMAWSIFFLAEYAYVLLGCCLAATFFFGGGASPFWFDTFVPSWIWFLFKVLVLMFCFLWFRWTFPRLRVDRVMDFCWKFLLPWSFVNLFLAGLFVWLGWA